MNKFSKRKPKNISTTSLFYMQAFLVGFEQVLLVINRKKVLFDRICHESCQFLITLSK